MAGWNMLPLPAYNPGGGIDYSVPMNALAQVNQSAQFNQQNALAKQQMGMQQERLGFERERLGMEKQQFDQKQQMATVQRFAGLAQGIDQITDPAQRTAAWQHLLRQHPNAAQLPEMYRDPVKGPKMLIQEAQGFVDPLDRQAKQAGLGLTRAQTAKAYAEAKKAGEKSEFDAALARLIGGLGPQGAPSPAPQGGIQPQSFGGSGPQGGAPVIGQQAAMPQGNPPAGDPNLILAQTPQQAPQGAPDLSPGQDMVDTPFGRMTRQKAQQMGMALAIGGKGDAGKMMGEFAQQGMPGKEARNEIEKKLFAATEQRSRLQGIRTKFKPDWQTVDEQLKQYGISWLDSIGPLRNKIPPEMRARHAEYTQYRQEAFTNMNQYIKDMTGAAMAIQEADRLRKGIPDPERDGPTAFESKMDNLMAQTDLAHARMNYLLRKGFQGKPWESGVSLERMQNIINERGAQIEKIMRQQNPQAPPQAIQRETFRLVKQEFGI